MEAIVVGAVALLLILAYVLFGWRLAPKRPCVECGQPTRDRRAYGLGSDDYRYCCYHHQLDDTT